jgi:hypothetical protein
LSIKRTANLGYFDGTLTTMKKHPEIPVRSVHAYAATLDAFLNWRHGSLLLYTNHLCSTDRYPFGNTGDLVSLLHRIRGADHPH